MKNFTLATPGAASVPEGNTNWRMKQIFELSNDWLSREYRLQCARDCNDMGVQVQTAHLKHHELLSSCLNDSKGVVAFVDFGVDSFMETIFRHAKSRGLAVEFWSLNHGALPSVFVENRADKVAVQYGLRRNLEILATFPTWSDLLASKELKAVGKL